MNGVSPGLATLLAEWEGEWVAGLANQVYNLHLRREIHDEFLEMLHAQEHKDTYVFESMFHQMYVESQVMAVRRQVDSRRGSLSLRRLIGQIEEHHSEFTRDTYVQIWMNSLDPRSTGPLDQMELEFHRGNANEAFDRFTDKPGGALLSRRKLADDRQELLDITADVERFATKNVAHLDGAAERAQVTYAQFDRAIDHLGKLLQRYYLLITRASLAKVTPVIQGDWKGPFRKPLA